MGMEFKENTKRNSKTYKKVIGYSQPWKMETSELLRFQTQSQSPAATSIEQAGDGVSSRAPRDILLGKKY